MKQWIFPAILCVVITACGSKKTEDKTELSTEQELQVVDSATQETKAHIDSLGKSVDELTQEVDSLLNKTK